MELSRSSLSTKLGYSLVCHLDQLLWFRNWTLQVDSDCLKSKIIIFNYESITRIELYDKKLRRLYLELRRMHSTILLFNIYINIWSNKSFERKKNIGSSFMSPIYPCSSPMKLHMANNIIITTLTTDVNITYHHHNFYHLNKDTIVTFRFNFFISRWKVIRSYDLRHRHCLSPKPLLFLLCWC